MTRRLHWLPWILPAAILCGCGGLLTSDQPPEHEYWLEAVTLQLADLPTASSPDLLVTVSAIPGLDTDRILVKGPGARLNYYAGARWPDHLPEVLAATVRLAFESSGRFKRVSGGSQASRAEWSLDLEVRKFFAVATTAGRPPGVQVELAGHLACGTEEFAIRAAATVPAAEDSLAAIVAAFQAATDETLTSLGGQLSAGCFGRQE